MRTEQCRPLGLMARPPRKSPPGSSSQTTGSLPLNASRFTISNTGGGCWPALRKTTADCARCIGGRKFDRLAVAYIQAYGSQSWTMRNLGIHLEEFPARASRNSPRRTPRWPSISPAWNGRASSPSTAPRKPVLQPESLALAFRRIVCASICSHTSPCWNLPIRSMIFC